jgi:hypothetical protein
MRGDVVSQSTDQGHLESGQLGTADVTASTVANIGPGIDFYFGFGVIAATAGVATALLVAAGYTVAIASVFTMSGGLVAMTISQFTSWHPWWGPFTVVLTAAAIWLTARGVKLSTVAVGAAVLVQVAIMLAVCFLVLVDQRAVLSGIPFSWAHLTGGLAGLSAGFPLALAHATITGFGYNVSSIGRSSVPFLTMSDHYLGGAAILAWIAGIASVLATLIAGADSQSRMLFDAGRTGSGGCPTSSPGTPGRWTRLACMPSARRWRRS